MVTLSLCFISMVAVAGVALAPILIRLLNPGWKNEESYRLCIWLAQVMYPFITLVSVTALVMGMLNAKKVFFIPAVASAFFNLGCIVGGIALAWVLDPGFRAGGITEKGLTGFAIGTLIGGALQLLVQLPSLHRVGAGRWGAAGMRKRGVGLNRVRRLAAVSPRAPASRGARRRPGSAPEHVRSGCAGASPTRCRCRHRYRVRCSGRRNAAVPWRSPYFHGSDGSGLAPFLARPDGRISIHPSQSGELQDGPATELECGLRAAAIHLI
jgi:hypothetical protein